MIWRTRIRRPRVIAAVAVVAVLAVAAGLTFALWPRDAAAGPPKAVIIDQLALTDPDVAFVNAAGLRLKAAGYAVDYYRADEVTVDFYRDLPKKGYKLIVIRSHASQQVYEKDPATGRAVERAGVALFTNERYSDLTHTDDQLGYRLGVGSYPQLGISDRYFLIGPGFVLSSMRGTFKDATIVLMGCGGLSTPDMAQAFDVLMQPGKIPLGIIYTEIRPTLESLTIKDSPAIAGLDIETPDSRYAGIQEAYR